MQKVQFTETILRDANQSLVATRLPYDKFEPILETIDQAGFYSVECWGGATFDVCLRFLNEDPWERLRKIRAAMPNTKLQMLLRGQNILGYKHYSDDVVRRFVRAAVRNGIDIVRIFDALNDVDNLKVAIEETVNSGAMASGAISYTTSPVHTLDKYVQMVKELKAMGVGSICIKDMAGILSPKNAYDLVSAIKDAVDLPVVVHTHSTTGLAFMTYLKSVEAGADVRCPAQDGRLLQADPGGLPGRRHAQPDLDGDRHPVPHLPDPRRHALESAQPTQDAQRP